MDKAIRCYFAEFLGTFALVFVGTAVAVLSGMENLAPHGARWLEIAFAFGFTLMVLVWVIGPVSGCHVNPAVTIPMVLSGRLKWTLAPGYILAQCIGGIAASVVLAALLNGSPKISSHFDGLPGYLQATNGLGANDNRELVKAPNQPKEKMGDLVLLGWEAVLTSLFVFSILAATRKDANQAAAGLAIGGFLFVAHLVGAQLGDSSLNPARSLGPALVQADGALASLWIFTVGPIVGGIVGWLFYKVVYAD
jgi:aquaporin Z